MKKQIIHLVSAARPNFMKIAPLYHVLIKETWCDPVIIHTGQHYDPEMSDAFFKDLNLPKPHIHLGVGSGTHAEQTGGVMVKYEEVCFENKPDVTTVVGDVNSTMACAITAKKLCIPVAHLEAGLRSGDRTMPEEINRIVTDSISDLLLTPSADADDNLYKEGISTNKILNVGNIMIDSYEMLKDKIEERNAIGIYKVEKDKYTVVTLHRPSNVDIEKNLSKIVEILLFISKKIKIVFPVHPRTKERLISFRLWSQLADKGNIIITSPQGYINFMSLVKNAKFIITDSGGIQEETTYLGIPCLTLRKTTERPITISQGSNRLVTVDNIMSFIDSILTGDLWKSKKPNLWDGHTAGRVSLVLKKYLNQ